MFKKKLFVFFTGPDVKNGDLSTATQIDTAYSVKEATENNGFLKEYYPNGVWFEFADGESMGSATPKIRLDI